MRRRRAPLLRAVLAAKEALALRGIRSPDEIDLEAIAADLRVDVRRRAIGNAEGRLVRSGRRGIISVDHSAYASEKWRFVLAHELGHFLLHEYVEELFCFPKKDATREEKSRSFLDEHAASSFGVELVLPEEMVRPRYDAGAPPMERARALAATFGISLPTTALRVLDFTDEPCAVAYSERGAVAWCTATKAFDVTVREDARLPEGARSGERRSVRAETWGRAAEGIEALIEESVKLEPFDAIVTILSHERRCEKVA